MRTTAIIVAAITAFAQAQESIDYQEPKTMVGFLFPGFDFGDLWEQLTLDQRLEVKQGVFSDVLT